MKTTPLASGLAVNSGRPRVLHVITVLGVGGVEVWLMALLERIKELGRNGDPPAEFDILMTGGQTSVLDERARLLGAGLHYIEFGRAKARGFARDFRRLLHERKYTAIHDHQDYSSAWHFLAGVGVLPPLRIVHVHNALRSLHSNRATRSQKALFEISRQAVASMATHVLGTSSQILQEYGFVPDAFPRQVVRTLHCGFDVTPFTALPARANASVCRELGWPEGSRICLFAGRLDGKDPRDLEWNNKNPRFALETVRAAIDAGADVRFVAAGDGDTIRAELESLAIQWGIADRVRFVGIRSDIPRLMAASHVCLFPSREEGLGMVAVEAQSAGLRVLAADKVPREAAVLRELVTFLPLAAGAEAWGTRLRQLIDLPRFDSVAAADAVRSSPFSIDHSLSNLLAIYNEAGASRA